ncbi:MAG: phytanoyl-CoA dioxygenase family protein [candidate division FCPU426 bacterium]
MSVSAEPRSLRGQNFDALGYHVERAVFRKDEIDALRQAFTEMHAKGGVKGHYEIQPEGVDDGYHHVFGKSDPLALYPRVMHPHKFMPLAKRALLDPRIFDIMEELTGEAMLTAQTMFYFKPPAARGQAWHQDNFYLSVNPGTCLAAWVAVDAADDDNGGLQIIPHTNVIPVICPDKNADPSLSFTKEIVPMAKLLENMGATFGKDLKATPQGVEVHKLRMNPGDILFFNGSVVHGSGPNQSKDRFRRSFICHYVGVSCTELAEHYHPLYNRNGQVVERAVAVEGGPCGVEQEAPH